MGVERLRRELEKAGKDLLRLFINVCLSRVGFYLSKQPQRSGYPPLLPQRDPRGRSSVPGGGQRSETPLRSCGRAQLRPGLPQGTAPGALRPAGERCPSLLGVSHREVAAGNHPPATSARFGTRAGLEDGSGFLGGYGLGSEPAVPAVPSTARAGPGSVSWAGQKEGEPTFGFGMRHPSSFTGPSRNR